MSYTPKQQGNSGGTGGPSQTNNQQQTAKVLAGIAGIQQQMQNLVHGQNAAGQGSPAAQANLNAFMALRQQQQQHNQHFESIIKQQQLYLSNPQLVQQFQQQIQQHQNIGVGGSGGVSGSGGVVSSGSGKEPLALTRTPAAAELLNKTLQQQQANGNTVAGINSASTVAATAATAQQIQQQLQALAQNPGNIMQQLQAAAYHHQMAQQQQQQSQQHQQYQSNRLPSQQQFQNQQQNLASSVPNVQQQQSQHAQQYPQTNYQQQQQQQKILSATSASAKTTPSIGGQIKPPNLPAATQITPIPSPSVTVQQQQSNANFSSNKNQIKPSTQQQQSQLPASSTSSRPMNTQPQQQPQQSSSISITPATTTTTGIISSGSGSNIVGSGANNNLTKSPILGNRSTISPITSIASSALHLHQKNSLNQQNSMVNIKHQSVSSKLPPPTQITAVPLTKPTVATSSPAKTGNILTANIQSPKGSNLQSLNTVNQSKSIVVATPAITATLPNNLGTSNESAKVSPQPSKPTVATQNKIPCVNNTATPTTNTTLSTNAATIPIISTITSPTTTTTTNLTITPVPAAVPAISITTTTTNVGSVVPSPSNNSSTQNPQSKKDDITKEPINNATSQDKIDTIKPNIVLAIVEKSNDKNIGKTISKDDNKTDIKLIPTNELKKTTDHSKVTEEKEIVETKIVTTAIDINNSNNNQQQKIVENNSTNKILEKIDLTNTITVNSTIEKLPTITNNTKTSEITIQSNTGSTISNVSDVTKKQIKIEKSVNVVKSPKAKSPAKLNPSVASSSSNRVNQKKKTNAASSSESSAKIDKSENKKLKNSSLLVAATVVKESSSRLRQTPAKSPSTPSNVTSSDGGSNSIVGTTTAIKTPEISNDKTDGRTKRHRLKTILYQSPLPELAFITKLSASEASNSPKPSQSNEDKLIVFYKNEFLAVRNADGGFFLCQTMQNVYKTSPKIRIRWLSEEKKDTNIYIPDFYDHTDIECVLTTVELNKINKERLKLPQTEKERIENILKKAIDVEKGILPRPDVTEENPDGLDISLYKNESQIEKKSSLNSSLSKKRAASKSPKRSLSLRSKTPKKKKKSLKKSNKKLISLSKDDNEKTEDDDPDHDQYESDEETEEEEYKPSHKKIIPVAQQLMVKVRAQRSPLAKARAASPITIKNQQQQQQQQQETKTAVPPKKSDDSIKMATSRNDRAKRRATDTSIIEEISPTAKKPSTQSIVVQQKKGVPQKISGISKTKSEDDDEPLVSPSNKESSELNTKISSSISKTGNNSTPVGKKLSSNAEKTSTSLTTTPTSSSSSSSTSGRPTRSRK